MKAKLALAALLVATSACTTAPPPPPIVAAPVEAAPPAPVVDPAAEDARLLAFVDAAFDAQVARSPQFLTALGSKERYGELNNYTEEYQREGLALVQSQLAQLRAQFDPARLGPTGRVTYELFADQAEDEIRDFRWRWHGFAASTNSSPMGSIPVFLINQHRVENVADAEAYISRLREVERVMTEISANMRTQTAMGIIPPKFNFAPVRADAKRVLAGAPFTSGADAPIFADFKSKVGKLDIAQAEKDRLIASAREALTGPFQRGYRTMLATWDWMEPKATGNNGAWSLPEGG